MRGSASLGGLVRWRWAPPLVQAPRIFTEAFASDIYMLRGADQTIAAANHLRIRGRPLPGVLRHGHGARHRRRAEAQPKAIAAYSCDKQEPRFRGVLFWGFPRKRAARMLWAIDGGVGCVWSRRIFRSRLSPGSAKRGKVMRKIALVIVAATLSACASTREESAIAFQQQAPQLVADCNMAFRDGTQLGVGIVAVSEGIDACDRLAKERSLGLANPAAVNSYKVIASAVRSAPRKC